jgi:hypothetical protein
VLEFIKQHWRKLVVAVATAGLLGVGVTAASAAFDPGTGAHYYGRWDVCVNNSTGVLRQIPATTGGKPTACKSGEKKAYFNTAGSPLGTGAQGPKGDAGPKGDTGSAGAPGPKGDAGAPGAPGAKGDPGTPGANGTNGTNGQDGADGKDGVFVQDAATLAAPKKIVNIGGPINTNNTDLGVKLTLPAGKYLLTVDGAFMAAADSSAPTVSVWPQLSLWIDKSKDGAFQWQQGEGDISPNALMPNQKDRHIWVHGSSVVELTEELNVGLLAFGYTSTQGSERSNEIDVIRATLTATPISEPSTE